MLEKNFLLDQSDEIGSFYFYPLKFGSKQENSAFGLKHFTVYLVTYIHYGHYFIELQLLTNLN